MNILKKQFFILFFISSFSMVYTSTKDKGMTLETTINFFDNKFLPVFSAGFIFYQVTKKKISLFKKISKTTEKRINFYSPISLLTLYSLFRVLNQKQELINKKQVREQAPGAQVGEGIVYINENGDRTGLYKNTALLFIEEANYKAMIATENAKTGYGTVKKRKAEMHKASDKNSDEEQ